MNPFPPSWRRAFTGDELERLAIRTVDGGMSDHEALKAEGLVARLWQQRAADGRPVGPGTDEDTPAGEATP